MKRLLLTLSDRLQNASAPSQAPGQMRAFLTDAYERLKDIEDHALASEYARIGACLLALGWITDEGMEKDVSAMAIRAGSESAEKWLGSKKEKKVIHLGVVAAGAGKNLATLHAAGQSDCISENMEDFLRHIEVRREKCLQVFSPSLPERDTWLERLDISILFSRWSRGQNDLRFLNAAFKLNDFWLPALKNNRDEGIISRLCLSLAEQELTAKELLR
jgi:hypothetical protein